MFPRQLKLQEQKTFDKHFRPAGVTVQVDFWNGEELQARLIGSEEGQRVGRTFFSDVELDRREQYRAIEAAGKLDTPQDALDRMKNIGGFLARRDAFFSYPATTHEADQPGPPVTPGTVMSYELTADDVAQRIDLVPRDDEAMQRYAPEFVINAEEGEAGQRAAAQLEEALREGREVEIDEGLEVTFTRLPPAFEDVVGKPLTGGRVILGKAEPVRTRPAAQPWKARLHAETDRGSASVEVELRQAEAVPDGWDDAFVGRMGGMDVTALFRQRGGRGELTWNFRHQRDTSPVREQLAALRFIVAFSGAGEFLVSDVGGSGRPELRRPTETRPLEEATQALVAFFNDVRAIEQWADVEFQLPDDISAAAARDVAKVASILRAGGRAYSWKDMTFTLHEGGLAPLQQGRPLRVEHTAGAVVLGQVVPLGHTSVTFEHYRVASTQPAEQPDQVTVRLEPTDGHDQLFEHLTQTATPAKPLARRPPPPPPRKGKRKGKGRGSRRRRK